MKSIIRIIALVACVFCTAIPSFAQNSKPVCGIKKAIIQGCDSPDPGNEDHYE